jgi:hypothetical protein
MVELEAQREDEGQDELDKSLAIVEELEVGGLILEIDGDGAVLAFGFGGLDHVSSPSRRWWVRMRHGEINVLKWQEYRERIEALPLNPVESGLSLSLAAKHLSFLTFAARFDMDSRRTSRTGAKVQLPNIEASDSTIIGCRP